MKRKLRGVKVESLKRILQPFPDAEYLCTYREVTFLILDKEHKHLGSVYLKEEIERKE